MKEKRAALLQCDSADTLLLEIKNVDIFPDVDKLLAAANAVKFSEKRHEELKKEYQLTFNLYASENRAHLLC